MSKMTHRASLSPGCVKKMGYHLALARVHFHFSLLYPGRHHKSTALPSYPVADITNQSQLAFSKTMHLISGDKTELQAVTLSKQSGRMACNRIYLSGSWHTRVKMYRKRGRGHFSQRKSSKQHLEWEDRSDRNRKLEGG